ncbi:MAG: HAD-IC family P-type ATPase [Ramlibacter sp.]
MTTELSGLSQAEVDERLQNGQVNRAAERTSRPFWQIIRANVFTRFNALLGSLLTVVLVVGTWPDALFGGVLVANSLIGIVQELRAKRTLDGLALLGQVKARVVRAGQMVQIAPSDIVLDDLIDIAPGDQFAVDGVVVAAHGLEIDESLLTGEAESVTKAAGDPVLSGSFVVAGSGSYQATQVGSSAYAGRLVAEARNFSPASSELRLGVDRILRYVGWAIAPVSVLLLLSQLLMLAPLAEALLFSSAGVVGMVPEGLVLLTSVALAMGAIRLGRRRALVQELSAIETLARVDVVCLDKTGTLTEHQPKVDRLEPLMSHPDTERALGALAAGDPTPNATLSAIAAAYPSPSGWTASIAVPFSSARKWSGASFGESGTWILGAPELVLANTPIDESVQSQIAAHTKSGYRVLLLASAKGTLAGNELPQDLTPIALVLLMESIRTDAAETLRYFAAQGVIVKVISGDHPATVAGVARQVGLPASAPAVDARELPSTPAALAAVMEGASVFGRVSPQQKQSMVAALQERGHVVAMVGDGVNDILGLKQADIGIAMGEGSGAARAVAQLVLLDNQFATLPAVVGEGRRVIGNVERLANLFVTKSVYAMLLAFAVGVADMAFPFLPRHLTLVGTLTIGIPAFFLSLESSVDRVRTGFVERVLRFAVPVGVLATLSTFAVYTVTLAYLGTGLGQARSAATVILFAVTLWVLTMLARPLNARRRLLIGAMALAFAIVLFVPWLRTFFALTALPLAVWLMIGGTAIAAGIAMQRIAIHAMRSKPGLHRHRFPSVKDMVARLPDPGRTGFLFPLLAALVILGSAWLFLGVLEDVVSHDPLVEVDVTVHDILQKLRTPLMDSVMVAVTEVGDVQVLLPVILATLAWFIWHRLWQTSLYWLAAIGLAEILVKILKFALHRPRPSVLYDGVERFSFPGSHATMSVVVYGFLAFLICRKQSAGVRISIAMSTALVIALIAFSRLYLGAHWASDVIAGMSLGLAWIVALAVAYTYRTQEDVKPKQLSVLLIATLLLSGSWHFMQDYSRDLVRYAPVPPIERN